MSKKQIIAMGGGGFSEEPDNPVLDEYFLKQTGKRNPSVCFIPTATGDADGYIVKIYTAFNKFRCRPCHLSLFRPPKDLADFVLSQDAIYVGGGVTRNLLILWREWGLDKLLRKAWRQGTLSNGVAADDGVPLHYIDTQLARYVSSRPDMAAYRVSRIGGRVWEEKIEVRYLGGKKSTPNETNQ